MKNEQLYLYYRKRAEDFGDYGLVAAAMGLVLWIPVFGVLCCFMEEETAKVLAPYVSFTPTIVFGLRHVYYMFRAWLAD